MRALFVLISGLMLISCSPQQSNLSNNSTESKKTEKPDCRELIIETTPEEERYPNSTILEYRLEQNCVWIKYQYSGCNQGEPTLVWNGIATKSSRPQVNMELFINEAGMCDQLLEGEAYFSMAKMHSVGSQVLVILNDNEKLNFLINSQGQP